MGTTAVRFIVAAGDSTMDSATMLNEEDLTSGAGSTATTIAASGVTGEVCVIYPITDNVRVAFGSSPTATTSAGPIAYAGQPNAFRNVKAGDKVAIINAT